MEISSPSFDHNMTIPERYTCQGENVSPPLIFEQIPKNALSLALIMDDPDAPQGTFDHWIVWNMLPTSKGLERGEKGLKTGINSYSVNEYKGPCPPPGKPHRYFFKLYALDTFLELPDSTTKKALEGAMQGHIIEQSEFIGIFERH